MKRFALAMLLTSSVVATLAGQDAKDDLKNLQGTWVMVSGEEKGENLSDQTIKNAMLTIVGDKHTVVVGKVTIVGTHKLNASKSPKEIDATDTEGPFKDKAALGIYKLDGDQFTVCFPAAGKDRPKEFTIKEGTGEFTSGSARRSDPVVTS